MFVAILNSHLPIQRAEDVFQDGQRIISNVEEHIRHLPNALSFIIVLSGGKRVPISNLEIKAGMVIPCDRQFTATRQINDDRGAMFRPLRKAFKSSIVSCANNVVVMLQS
jgi:hypothetical protein